VQQLGAATLTYLRDEDLPQALLALGEATDSLPAHASQNKADAGLVPAAAGLNRQLVRLKSDERFDLLYAWSMPTESRRTVRVLSLPVPNGAPPKEFARALGERPRNHSFAVAEINGVRGLFSTACQLVRSARDTGQLRRLTSELSELSRQHVPGADHVLTLGRIVAADRRDEQLEKELQDSVAKLRRDQPVELRGNGPVPDDVIWQYGYTQYNEDPERIDFKPFPYWSGLAWQGTADYPSENLGWMMMDAAGGHAERDFTPVRRWVAPANGTLSISGNLRHWYGQGDGVRGRIVSSRGGVVGEWTSLNGMTSTVIESINVEAWDTINFVTDRITNPMYDRFDWPVQLKLTTASGDVLQFDTASVSPGPSDVSVLADLVLAVACLDHEWLQPIGESMIRTLRDHGYGGASAVLQPLLQRTHALAVAMQFPNVSPTLFTNGTSNAGLQHWAVTGGSDSNLDARGASQDTWLTHEDPILHLSGAGNSALFFRYPLTGKFEFSCEAQQGGRYSTDGGLVYGGLQFMTHSDRKELTVWDADIARFVKKPYSFLRMGKGATFNWLSIKSTASGTTFAVNGHPTWQAQYYPQVVS